MKNNIQENRVAYIGRISKEVLKTYSPFFHHPVSCHNQQRVILNQLNLFLFLLSVDRLWAFSPSPTTFKVSYNVTETTHLNNIICKD